MLRHAALCLYLLVQCATAIEWDELVDRVQDHHDTIDFPGAENRDDWFWDDNFWRYPHMTRMECPDGYGWEGNYKDGYCEACQPGHYSASWGPTVRCVSCPPGTYQPSYQSHECNSCPEWSPLSAAESKSSHDCHKWPIGDLGSDELGRQGNGKAKVEAKVEVMGDWTFLNDMLEQISGYEAHDMSAHVMYDAERDCSMGTVTLVMAERAAFEAHMYVQDLKTMIHLVNDWIYTGHSYVNRISSMLNLADSLYLIGLNMDPSKIHHQLKDLRVETIDSSLHFSCNGAQANDDGSKLEILGAMSIFACIEDDVHPEHHSAYVSYGGVSEVCSTLGGKARLAQKIKHHWEVEGCKEDDACHMSLLRCTYNEDTKESFVVVYVAKKYADIDLDLFDDVKLFDNMDIELNLIGKFKNCAGGPFTNTYINDDSEFCLDKCPKFVQLVWGNGRCEDCPFGTYYNNDVERCYPCDFELMSATYNYGYKLEACFSYPGGHSVMLTDVTQDQERVFLDRSPFNIPHEYRHHHQIEIEGKLDVCYAVGQKKEFREFCAAKYDLQGLSFDDFTDFDLTKLSCLAMDRISNLYDANCKDREYSWPPAQNFYWLDAACMVVGHIQRTEQQLPDNDISKCDSVNEDVRVLTMPFLLPDFTYDVEWGSVILPLLEHKDTLTHGDYSTITTAVRGMMHRFGVYDTSQLTGLEMANHLRDLIIEVPENLKVSMVSWEKLLDLGDALCENGHVKKDCRSACAIPINQCMQKSGDDHELTCSADECNECQVSYTVGEEPYECVSCELWAEFNPSEHEFLSLISVDPDVKGKRIFHVECDAGQRLSLENGAIDYGNCKDEEQITVSCDVDGNAVKEWECAEDKCSMPTEGPENGHVKQVHAPKDRGCRIAEMACNPGYQLEGDPIRYCDLEGNWSGDMPTCEPVECEGDDSTIEHGKLINHLVGGDVSLYRCDVLNPSYNGDMDYFTAKTCGETIVCGKHEDEHCPTMIDNGYKVREWEVRSADMSEPRVWNAEYRCNPRFEIENNPALQSIEEAGHGWSHCVEGQKPSVPQCVAMQEDDDDGEGPCKMPQYIYNGNLVEEFTDDEGKVTHGKYKCDEGFMMVETNMDDHGFCREMDFSYELPSCVEPNEWRGLEFELIGGGYKKMQNAGRVKARNTYNDGTADDWYAGCDDHFNSPAAGSICRTLGFNYGKMIDAPRRMRPIPNLPFGITNFWCYYDDVLPMSPSCHTDDYGMVGYPICLPDEQIAVSCFDVWWKVDVEFHMKSKRKDKMFCPVDIEKEGIKMKTKKMGLSVKWGGLIKNQDTNEYEYTEFEEGIHYEGRRFSRKKGFRATFIGNKDDYDCFYCNIHLGEAWLNPGSENNHNCGMK